MSEKKSIFSKFELLTIGIIFVAILLIGLILLGLNLNEAFYSTSSTVRDVFKVITNLGEPLVFIIIVAIFYIVYDKRFAKNLAMSLLFTYYLNEFLKDLIKDPRPASNATGEVTPENPGGLIETSYGFPSGHTQASVGTWGYMAYEFKDRPKRYLMPIIFSVIIFLVAISRMIIGAHDLQDVIGGLLIGLAALMIFIYGEPIISKGFNKLSMNMKILIVIIISVAIFLIGILLFPTSGLDLLPPALRKPYTDTGSFAQVGGVILGLGIGYVLENEKVNYQPKQMTWKQKIVNLIIGLIIVIVLYLLLDLPADIINSVVYRYFRYAIIAFVLTFLIPIIFTKLWKRQKQG
jgi:membrane-associated phospholipid phosphatase